MSFSIRVSCNVNQGSKPYMEDFISVKENTFFGVFDGHGGKEAAKCVSEQLWDIIKGQPKFSESNPKSVMESLKTAHLLMNETLKGFRSELS